MESNSGEAVTHGALIGANRDSSEFLEALTTWPLSLSAHLLSQMTQTVSLKSTRLLLRNRMIQITTRLFTHSLKPVLLIPNALTQQRIPLNSSEQRDSAASKKLLLLMDQENPLTTTYLLPTFLKMLTGEVSMDVTFCPGLRISISLNTVDLAGLKVPLVLSQIDSTSLMT